MLFVLLSVANIALGYGLAIHLGHALAPWAADKRATNYRPSASGEESRESRHDYTGTIDQDDDENHDESVAETVAETADELAEEVAEVEEDLVAEELRANDETSPEERPTAEIAGAVEGDAVEGDASDETPEVSAEQEVLDSVETIQEEIQEQPEPPTVEEALATDVESSIPEPTFPESQDEQETAASATVSEGELMQGIGAFQEQLKSHQERSKLHAVTDTSKDEPATEASSESDGSDASTEPAVRRVIHPPDWPSV